MAPADTILLQSILDRIASLDAKVETIAERQAVIAERVDAHIASSEPKSGMQKSLDLIKGWLMPIVLAIFLLGRQSVETVGHGITYTDPKPANSSALLDDTFIDRNRKFDAAIMKQIMKTTGEK